MLDFVNMPINSDMPYLFTCGSSFSGCGGSSLGIKWARGKVLFAIEWDENAVQTYRLNHFGTPVLHRDIALVTVEELLTLTGLRPGELDLFEGSPPCQGFSTSGKRQFDDPRNSLFKEFIRLLRGVQPKVFVMENVSGMVKGDMKHIFVIVMKELKASGYQVKCQLMNTAYFGVPQLRERMLFIGVRNDLSLLPSYPSAQTQPITPRVAFAHLEDKDAPELPDWLKKASREMIAGNYSQIHAVKAFKKYKGVSGGGLSTKLLSWDRCSCTLTKSEIATTGIIHPDKQRYLSIGEMKRIASFPDGFQFVGNRKNAVERIGNSVPPLFMKYIADHIYIHTLSKVQLLDRITEVPHA
jgi:DNA (cytosine-5)-methyltransferase 1